MKNPTEMQTRDKYETLAGRFANTLGTGVILICILFFTSATAFAKTIIVTGTGDTIAIDGLVTLREAMTAANTNAPAGDAPAGQPGLDLIYFNIAGGGVHTIHVMGALPTITESLLITGYSQPGTFYNNLAVGDDRVLLIELDGTNSGPGVSGLTIAAPDCYITGLIINRFQDAQIQVLGPAGHHADIYGNFIGTDATGTSGWNVGKRGIYISGEHVEIGGADTLNRNVISGMGGCFPCAGSAGIYVDGSQGSVAGADIRGNFIGTDKTGAKALPNHYYGIELYKATDVVIGGTLGVGRNVLSGNTNYGLLILGSSNCVVRNNFMGVDAAGVNPLGNGISGVAVSGSTGITLGGNQPGQGNVLAGNVENGLWIEDSDGQIVQGNFIGTNLSRTVALGNGQDGIVISPFTANNQIGGTVPGAGNTIAFNHRSGVALYGAGLYPNGNAINGNAIYQNGGLGIDLGLNDGPNDVTPNDPNDSDGGPNHLQNYPVLATANSVGGLTSITGTLASTPNTQFRLEFFTNITADSSGFGEGENFLGFKNVTTDGSGNINFSAGFLGFNAGQSMSATATDPQGDTSEFSPARLITGLAVVPNMTINDITIFEPDSSQSSSLFTVTLSAPSSQDIFVNYATADGTADSSDYFTNGGGGTLKIPAGQIVGTIEVYAWGDTMYELDETFFVNLSNPVGATLTKAQGVGTIKNYGLKPTITIDDVAISEGNNGTTPLSFEVKLSNASYQQITVSYTTAGGTATSGVDFQAANSTFVFNSGETSKTITVKVNGDTTKEPDETFFVNLSNPINAAIVKAQGLGTIKDDDGPQAGSFDFSAPAYSVSETGGVATITVKRTGGSNGAVSVQYATGGGMATVNSDYTSAGGTLNWADGDSADKTFTIPLTNDQLDEPDETVGLALSSPAGGATLGVQASAVLTITDDDLPPSLSISDVSVAEGDSGTTPAVFKITMSAPSGKVTSVFFTTVAGTATKLTDYQQINGDFVNFNPGETTKIITVGVFGDTTPEPDETFSVNLFNPIDATIDKAEGLATILNDDGPLPGGSLQFSAASFDINEGGGQATIMVTRTGGSNGAVSVQYATVAGGTATFGSDYTSTSGTLNWADGDTTDKTFTIAIVDDSLNEPAESVKLALSNPAAAQLGALSAAVLSLTDNDAQPGLSISEVSLAEGNSSTTNFTFDITLSTASGQTVTVDFVTVGGSATLGSDFQLANGTLTFNPGETSKSITVLGNGDTTEEPNETFVVNLNNITNAVATKASGTGTIINDDAVAGPAFAFSQASYGVAEQLGVVSVTVVRSGDTNAAAAVDYATSDGSATQKGDFEITAGTLNFAPGETSKTIQVLLNQDSYLEGAEGFNVVLSNASGASLGQPSTNVTITDDVPESLTNPIDDAQSFVHLHYHDFLNREPDQAGLQFWTNEITGCGADAACIAAKRTDVSAAFFLSIEFQRTGYLLYLLQKESFASLPKYNSFMRDLQEVSRGVVVNSPGWEQKLAANQQEFAEKWIARPSFRAAYDGMSNTAYINALYANAGVVPPQAEREALVAALDQASVSRAAVLLDVAGNAVYKQQEQNAAFVLMQYFSYLRRDPDSAPDSDLSGYYFWLNKLNSFNGDYQQAEMVKAFLLSAEYRGRFGLQ